MSSPPPSGIASYTKLQMLDIPSGHVLTHMNGAIVVCGDLQSLTAHAEMYRHQRVQRTKIGAWKPGLVPCRSPPK